MLIGFGEGKTKTSPFPYKTWDKDFLPESLYNKLEQQINNLDEDTTICPAFDGFRDLWHMPQYKKWLQEQLGWPPDVPALFEVKVVLQKAGDTVELNRNLKARSPKAFGSIQINFGDSTATDLYDDEQNKVDRIEFKRNTAFCFLANHFSWHSVDTIPNDRRSIVIEVSTLDKAEMKPVVNPNIYHSFRDHTMIDFCITTYCQSKCPTCPRTDESTLEVADFISLQHMPFSVWHSVADRVDWSNKTIQFCGEHGDPMMHPDIEKFILAGVEMAWRVQVNTNGGIRTPEWYDEIYNKVEDKDYGDLIFVFAIDGLTQQTNEKYRINVDFNRAWQNFLTCARKYRRLTQWDFLVFEHNWHELEDVIKTAKELDVQVDIKVNRADYGLLRSAEGKKHVSKVLGVEL